MNPQDANSLFTITSLLSLQGSAAASLLVPNALRFLIPSISKSATKWIAFLIAMGLSFIVAYIAPTSGFLKWVLAFFNGFLVFTSAMGINQAASGATLAQNGFFASWF